MVNSQKAEAESPAGNGLPAPKSGMPLRDEALGLLEARDCHAAF